MPFKKKKPPLQSRGRGVLEDIMSKESILERLTELIENNSNIEGEDGDVLVFDNIGRIEQNDIIRITFKDGTAAEISVRMV